MTDIKKPNLGGLTLQLNQFLGELRRSSLIIFVVFVGLVYGFIFYQINNLSNAQPTQDAVTSQVRSAQVPHIDKNVVKQLEALQDNSVNVQTLFDQARSNPFQ